LGEPIEIAERYLLTRIIRIKLLNMQWLQFYAKTLDCPSLYPCKGTMRSLSQYFFFTLPRLRQFEPEGVAFAVNVVITDGASHKLDRFLGDGQSDAGAFDANARNARVVVVPNNL